MELVVGSAVLDEDVVLEVVWLVAVELDEDVSPRREDKSLKGLSVLVEDVFELDDVLVADVVAVVFAEELVDVCEAEVEGARVLESHGELLGSEGLVEVFHGVVH